MSCHGANGHFPALIKDIFNIRSSSLRQMTLYTLRKVTAEEEVGSLSSLLFS